MIGGCVSIIIPAYNIERYIGRCIDSILCQIYTNFEIIVVDNNSKDRTAYIVKKYCEKDSRVKYLKCIEPGVCNARNMGLDNISGEWFCFIDADDWIEPDYLKVLIDNAVKYECSVSACSYLNDNGANLQNKNNNEVIYFDSSSECIHNFICDSPSMEGMVWNKIYSSSQYADIRFDPKIRVNEDCEYTFEIMSRCQKACLSLACLYHWFVRMDSACRKHPEVIELNNADVFLDLLCKTNYLNDDEIECKLKLEYVRIITNMLIYVKYKFDSKELNEVRRRLIEWRVDVFPYLNKRTQRYYSFIIYKPYLMNIIRVKNRIIDLLKSKLKKILCKSI